jgi:hypothetical protein
MATKQQLHDLIERLPDDEIPTVYRLLAGLLADPLWLVNFTAPEDDEPYTAEQRVHDAEAQADIDSGAGIPHEDILREFGLK